MTVTSPTLETQPEDPQETSQLHPIIAIANKLFPDNPNSFYVNLRDSIKIDIYYNALKVARDEWGYQENSEKMQIWLDDWWINTVFSQKYLQNRTQTVDSPTETLQNDQQQSIQEIHEYNGELQPNSNDNDAPTQNMEEQRLNESIEAKLEDPTEIMKVWRSFILEYSKPRTKIEIVPDPNAKKSKGKPAPTMEQEVTLPAAFNVDDIREMTEYLSTSLFQFYDVYKFVLGEERSTTESTFKHVLQQPIIPPAFIDGRPSDVFEEEKRQKEQALQQAIEDEKRAEESRLEQVRREREEQALREREEREAPRLSSEQLAEIASYLKYHLNKNLTEKEEQLISRVCDLQDKLAHQEASSASVPGKKK